MGKGGVSIEQPKPPAQPSTADAVKAYTENLPAMYNLSLEYDPKFAQQSFDMAQQFAPQYKALQESLYPETTKLQEDLAKQASENMNADLPEHLKQAYQDQFRAEIGENAGAGIGADYVSRRMVAEGENYRNYYRNLGLTMTGRQPLYQSSGYQPPNTSAGFNFQQVQNSMNQNYGTYSGAYTSMYNTNAQVAMNTQNNQYGMYSAMLGAGSSMFI